MITKEDTQLLKGIAIFMVIVEHLGQVLSISALNPLGPIGVCLFLFISGYGLSCSYEKNGRHKYFSKRLIKVYIPYLVSIGLFSIWSFAIDKALNGETILNYVVLRTLPQGSFWYLRLLFYWYIVFFFLTFAFDNKKVLTVLLCIATILITIYSGFNRLYVWQFASFPAGIIAYRNKNLIEKKTKKIFYGGLLLVVSFIMVVLKKTAYVESHELGVADTILQIGITWCISLFMIWIIDYLKKLKLMKKTLLIIGSISYELYLAHVLPLDWLKQNVTIKGFLIYGLIVVMSTAVLYAVNYFLHLAENSLVRN